MPVRNPDDLPALLRPGQRLLGLDVGTKTVGLALSDPTLTIATPLTTVKRGKFAADAATIFGQCRTHGAAALVIGLPIGMDGIEGPRCQSVRQFARNLEAIEPMDIIFWDERLSTAAVTRGMIEADLSRKRRSEIVDRAAAAYILQGALDFLKRSRT